MNYSVRKCKTCHLVQILLCYLETSEMLNKLICSALHLFITAVSVCSLCFSSVHVTSLFLFDSLNRWCFSWIISFCKTNQSNKLWLEQHGCRLMNITYWQRRKRDLWSTDLLIWSGLLLYQRWGFFVASWGKKLKASQEVKSALQWSIWYSVTRAFNTCVHVYKTVKRQQQ